MVGSYNILFDESAFQLFMSRNVERVVDRFVKRMEHTQVMVVLILGCCKVLFHTLCWDRCCAREV